MLKAGIFASFLVAVAVSSLVASAVPLSLFEEGKHCVAYKTTKRLMLIKNVTVIGRNCEIASQVIPALDNKYFLEVTIPVRSFESGESERDKDVVKILKGDKQPNMVFQSEELTHEQWQELFASGKFDMKGFLDIGGTRHPVTAEAQIVKGTDGMAADGVIRTRFDALDIKPPSLVVGLITKVRQDVELHFRLQASKTLGARSLIPAPDVEM